MQLRKWKSTMADYDKCCTNCYYHDLIYILNSRTNDIDSCYLNCRLLDKEFEYEEFDCEDWAYDYTIDLF